MKLGSILTAAAMAAAFAIPAAATTYHCTIKPRSNNDFVPPEIYIDFDESSADVVVFDGIIKEYVGNPIKGTLRSTSATRLLFGWSVPGVKNSRGQYTAGLTYSINIVRATGAASITGKPQGYVNQWHGSGTCKIEE